MGEKSDGGKQGIWLEPNDWINLEDGRCILGVRYAHLLECERIVKRIEELAKDRIFELCYIKGHGWAAVASKEDTFPPFHYVSSLQSALGIGT